MRNSDAFRRIGKRYELPGCVLVYSSHFVDRDQVANGRGAVWDGAKFRCKSLKNEISAAAYYSNHGKYSFGSAIYIQSGPRAGAISVIPDQLCVSFGPRAL